MNDVLHEHTILCRSTFFTLGVLPDPSQDHLRSHSQHNTLLMMWMVGYVFHIPIPQTPSPLSIPYGSHPNYADSVSSKEQLNVYLSVSYLDQTLKISLSCCTTELFFLLLYHTRMQWRNKSINETIIKIFVIIIWINSQGYQVQRHQCLHGKMRPLRSLFLSRKEA